MTVAAKDVVEEAFVEVTVIPVPKETVPPDRKFVPVSVITVPLAPCVIEEGEIEDTVGVGALTVSPLLSVPVAPPAVAGCV